MSSPILNWKRFWCPREGSYQLTGEGYLLDYDAGTFFSDSGIVTLENLFDIPCLILLGEPGIGKSTEILKHSKFIEEKTRETGDEFLRIDLKDYQTDQMLFDEIFQNPSVKRWQKGENRLYLFLDSLDEALLNINVLSTALPNKIESQKLPVERLYFRIASRVADWPVNLEERLKSIWGENKVHVYELLPLRKVDVEDFAKAYNIDSATFTKKIEERDGQPFAIKPVTLKFLTKTYLREGDIPKSKKELYLTGCQYLCTEEESRRVSRRAGNLTPEQRLKIVGRIAALSLFSNKSAIWIGANKDDCQESDLAKQAVYGGKETVNGIDFAVGSAEVSEALNTGVFSARGTERLGWSHRTYAEFLAAWYLTEHKLDESKILSLISHPGDMNQRLIPQLQETSAWLATFSERIFTALMDRNPEVLLRSDVIVADESARASLVQSFLTMHDSGRLFELAWSDLYYYKKLGHSGLEDQLRRFMCDKTKGFRTRRLAIDIAEECNCIGLLNELAEIALDVTDLLVIREQAAHAVSTIGDKSAKLKLKALITNSGADDQNDELRAYGFKAIWPDHISADELFELISPPRQVSVIGSYWSFLDHSLIQNLKVQDIPTALNWVIKYSATHMMPAAPLTDLTDKIMLLGWENLNQPGILRPFTLAALARINNHYGIFSWEFTQRTSDKGRPTDIIEKDDEKRHTLILEVFTTISQVSVDLDYLIFGHTPLIYRRDFDWLIKIYSTINDASQKSIIAGWLNRICDPANSEQVNVLYSWHQTDPIFREKLSGWFDAIIFDSEQAKRLKKWYSATQGEPKKQVKVIPSLTERIKILLDKNEEGDTGAWWSLNLDLTIDEANAKYGNEFEQDITELPGWEISDNSVHERIVLAAKRYIINGEPNNKEWMGKNIIYRPAMAGYRALRLVLKTSHEDILGLDSQIWKKWAPIILAYPMRSSEDADILDDTLVKVANIYASDEINNALAFFIKKENRKNGFIGSLLSRLKSIWNEKYERTLVKSLKSKKMLPNLFREMLAFLLQHHSTPAQELAIRKARQYKADNTKEDREMAIAAIQLYFIYSEDLNWDAVWDLLKNDFELANAVIESVASHHESQKIFARLTYNQLAELYLFLLRHYPPEEDPKYSNPGFHKITDREEIGEWRDAILSFMANSGSPDACAALQKLATELPHSERLQYMLFRAQFNMRQKTWMPLSETELLSLFLRPETILIESGQDLLDAILQSLKSLDSLFQGETPMAIYLWNERNNKGVNLYRPKDENRLSDYVKAHLEKELKQKGIVVNREVEIRRGEETDIRIDALKKTTDNHTFDVITVIIETKGCWNRELTTAMKTQLRDRYLKNNGHRFGLYLIGWFKCGKWDKTDHRYKASPNYSLNKAKSKFESQSASLCTEEILLKSYILNLSI